MARISRRGVLGGMLALAAANALPWVPVPAAAEGSIAPNPLQLDLIKKLLARFDYLAFADTNHERPEIDRFLYSEELVGTLAAAGVPNVFVELPPKRGAAFENIGDDFADACENSLVSDWITAQLDRSQICSALEKSLTQYPAVKFIAADRRREGKIWQDALKAPLRADGIDLYNAAILNDTNTVEYIKTFAGHGVIMFGSAHFDGKSTIHSHEDNFRNLLQQAGKSLCVINMYADEEEKAAYDRKLAARREKYPHVVTRAPDVEFFIKPPADNPSGIVILNAALYTECPPHCPAAKP